MCIRDSMTIERLKTPSAGKLNALTDLWEASVRATHDFLAPEDIAFFRQMVRQEALRGVELYVIRKPDSKAPETGTSAGQENRHESRTSGKTGESRRPEGLDENGMFGGFAAFAGIDGDMLEMLFVAPKARGKGVGRQLVEYLVRERGIRQVDVNEQNAQAALSVADRAYVLETGKISLTGTGAELMASDAVRKAYLGG